MTESRRTNIDLQNTNHKTKDRVTRTTRKIGNELKYPGRVSNCCSTCGTHRVTLATNPMIIHE
jgi:3'-phosphoadenosine 5'-phosphosulfate sulfotransferase (PAPS reductase)/FAD synthetase